MEDEDALPTPEISPTELGEGAEEPDGAAEAADEALDAAASEAVVDRLISVAPLIACQLSPSWVAASWLPMIFFSSVTDSRADSGVGTVPGLRGSVVLVERVEGLVEAVFVPVLPLVLGGGGAGFGVTGADLAGVVRGGAVLRLLIGSAMGIPH